MTAWLWVVAGFITWLAIIGFGLALCIAGKRADEAAEAANDRAAGPPAPEEPPAGGSGRPVSSQRAFLGRRRP